MVVFLLATNLKQIFRGFSRKPGLFLELTDRGHGQTLSALQHAAWQRPL